MFLVEMFATCGLVTTIITIKYHSTIKEGVLAALTVGLTLLAMICWSSGISGGCLNPAIGIANSIVQYAMKDQLGDYGFVNPIKRTPKYVDLTLSSLPIYIFAPLMGGVVAGVFQLLNGKVDKIMKEAAAE
jgi:glycerol uptake facilitator-like aquaporin